MKYVVSVALVIGLAFGMLPVQAGAPMSVAVRFRGNYLGSTCRVVSSPDMTVTLPKVSTRSLPAAGDTAGSTMFTISLRCDSGVSNVRVYFEGGPTVDPSTGNLVLQPVGGRTSAGNVQIMLSNPDGSQIKVGDRSTMKVIPVTSADPIPVYFVASYRATGATTPGGVNTHVSYVVELP